MKSIRKQLFVIITILALVPALTIGTASMIIMGQSMQSITYKMMDNHAKDILRRTEDRLSYLEQGFTEFAASGATISAVRNRNKNLDVEQEFIKYMFTFLLSKPEVTRLLFVREDDSVFGYNLDTFIPNANPGYAYKDQIFSPEACQYIDDFMQRGGDFASPGFPFYLSDKTNNANALLLCQRILDPDTYEPVAVMVAHISFLESPSLFNSITLWPEEEITLLRGDGLVLASTEVGLVGEQRGLLSQRETPQHSEQRIDGVSSSFSAIRGKYDVEIQVMVPQSVLQEATQRQLLVQAAILGFTVALLVLFLYKVKNRFFGKLGSFSRRLRSQKKSPLNPIEGEWGDDEIGELVYNYNLVTEQAREQFFQERDRLERLKELELSALQSQIKPHFLYNTLDVGVWLSKEGDVQKIQELLIKLSRYYRLSLSSGASCVPIRDELHHARLYLEMEQLRMSDAFQLIVDVPEEIQQYYIDKITIQPIVENCIKHGIKPDGKEQGQIAITGRMVDGDIVLTVDDNGVGMDEETLSRILEQVDGGDGSGFAVANVHRRLVLRYGQQYGLRYQSSPGIGTSVRILLPGTE